MTIALQPSLFDSLDASPGTSGFGPLAGRVRRTPLAHGAWVDHLPGWLSGADALFAELVGTVDWRAEQRQMYDRVVAVPRLLAHFGERDPLPHPLVAEAKERLDGHYARELGEPFRTAGLCFYRDGHDSVAWHGDRIGRGRSEDTMVAILSLGEARRLLLRPNGGGAGRTLGFSLGHGDLLVMGGSCQRTWEHCVPKSARPCGPRISIQFRPRAVL